MGPYCWQLGVGFGNGRKKDSHWNYSRLSEEGGVEQVVVVVAGAALYCYLFHMYAHETVVWKWQWNGYYRVWVPGYLSGQELHQSSPR